MLYEQSSLRDFYNQEPTNTKTLVKTAESPNNIGLELSQYILYHHLNGVTEVTALTLILPGPQNIRLETFDLTSEDVKVFGDLYVYMNTCDAITKNIPLNLIKHEPSQILEPGQLANKCTQILSTLKYHTFEKTPRSSSNAF